MPLNVTKKGDKEYLYFKANGPNKLYLGTTEKPNVAKIEEAIGHLNARIGKYENEKQRLENLLLGKRKFNIIYQLVAFDLDGVIFDKPWRGITTSKVAVSTWDKLFQELGMYDTHEKYKQKFENDGWSIMEWTDAACKAIQPVLERETFEKVINQRPFMPGARELFKILRKEKVITAVITGSFDALAQRASRELGGIDHTYAHAELHFNSNGSLEDWRLNPTDYEDKVIAVEQIAREHRIPLDKCAYVGDDVNDVSIFKKVGLSIAFNSDKSEVNQAAKVVIESRNLQSILAHLEVKK